MLHLKWEDFDEPNRASLSRESKKKSENEKKATSEAPLGVFGIRDVRGKKLPGYGIFEEKVIGIQDIEK